MPTILKGIVAQVPVLAGKSIGSGGLQPATRAIHDMAT